MKGLVSTIDDRPHIANLPCFTVNDKVFDMTDVAISSLNMILGHFISAAQMHIVRFFAFRARFFISPLSGA